jgi:2-keto-4-pentenoate hydratase/2-oxohepta-3-ene-1,7-dioic acid hydratase in catechol pathway
VKLVVFVGPDHVPTPGLLTDGGVVGLGDVASSMEDVIDHFDDLRSPLERLAREATPLGDVRLLAPVPRPGKILCSTGGYGEPTGQPLLMTLKSAESVIGPGGVVQLPAVGDEWQFVPEAELGLVVRGPAKSIRANDWRDVVFGYTCVVDVMARGDTMFGRDFWLAKADTLGPLGPCIVTADEIVEPNALRVQSFLNSAPLQDYSTATAEYSVPQLVEFATTVMTLYSGDILACGTSASGLRPVSDGDALDVVIESIGQLSLRVATLATSHA